MTEPVPLRASRRELLALGLVLGSLPVTGCDAIAPDPPSGRGPSDAGATATADVDAPDQELVTQVRADLVAASTLLASSLRVRPALEAELGPFLTLHDRHLRALEGERIDGSSQPVRGDAATVRAAARDREARLQTDLESAALAARSGPLAALLASMAAAVAQQLAATDRA